VTIDERLEKLTERHEALTQSLELLVHRQADAEERQIAAEERHDREMDDIRREERAMRADLRRAFALGVREARGERRRRQELDGKITQLAAAQLVTEEKLQRLIDSMGRGGNGNPRGQ
jgi:hypothetical protein